MPTLLLPLLLGCGPGTFDTEEGAEPIRAALYFAPDSTLSLALQDSRQIYVLLANSTIPCYPEAVEDDPETAADEPTVAGAYWDAQRATAFAREGAVVVAMVLAVSAETDWLGRFPIQSDAWDLATMGEYVADDGRVAAGGYYRVEESSVADANGVLYASGISVDDAELQLPVGAPAWVEIAAKDQVLRGTFDYAPVAIAGSFEAERCDNSELLTEIYQYLATLALQDPDILEEFPDDDEDVDAG